MLKIQHKNFNRDRFYTSTKYFLLCSVQTSEILNHNHYVIDYHNHYELNELNEINNILFLFFVIF